MQIVGSIESLWRYPVKSMRGEEVDSAFVGFSGVYGDRFYGFLSSEEPAGFPFITSREVPNLLQYLPRFRNPELASRPPNLEEAQKMAPGITPVYADWADLAVDVIMTSGEVVSVDDPRLAAAIADCLKGNPELTLVRSARSITDCRPVSLFSIQTARQLSAELGQEVDKRRFRANVYLDLEGSGGFAENAYVGKRLKLGEQTVISVLERDPRCKVITMDPDTSESAPEFLRPVAQLHEGAAGLYAAVLVEGMVNKGDCVEVMD